MNISDSGLKYIPNIKKLELWFNDNMPSERLYNKIINY
jgi:hypothetical protein